MGAVTNYPDRYPTWVHEQAPGYHRPTAAGTLFLGAIVTLLLLSLLGGPSAYAEHVQEGNTGKPPTLCAEHHGRPGWDAVCKDAAGR